MPQTNTLFNYFSKTPSSGNTPRTSTPHAGTSRSANTAPSRAIKKPAGGKSDSTTPKRPRNQGSPPCTKWEIGDLVWAKLDGYPWWPSLVSEHPSEKVHQKPNKVHVQFIDTPPTRSWVQQKFVKKYGSPQSTKVPVSSDVKWKKSCSEANRAMEMSLQERLEMIVLFEPSDESESDTSDVEDGKENVVEQSRSRSNSRSPRKNQLAQSASSPPKKRRRIMLIESGDDDSEDEYKPDKKDAPESDSGSSGEDESKISDMDVSEPELTPVKKPTRKTGKAKTTTPSSNLSGSLSATPARKSLDLSFSTKSKLASFSANDSVSSTADICSTGNWTHTQLDFLKPGRIQDIKRRPKEHPEYDPRTLHVPSDFLSKQTPAMKQWWELKSKHFDVVFFFKVGKFYELYHMDAVVGVKELGLIFMKGEKAHSGFPETAYSRFSATLIEKGYKVARIEQTETPEAMNERLKKIPKAAKADRVVRREICRISTKATRTYSFIDGDPSDAGSSYLLALIEKGGDESQYGVCFVDTSIGLFYVGQFSDDRHCSRLRTLLAHYPPAQLLYERGCFTPKTQQLVQTCLGNIIKDALHPHTEFWESSKTLKFLAEGDYFLDEQTKAKEIHWPEIFSELTSESDSLGLTSKECYDLALRSLGACVWYLMDSCLDQELLSRRLFQLYTPVDQLNIEKRSEEKYDVPLLGKHMVLDGVAMKNLDVVQNSATGTTEGTLLQKIDYCSTAFGKRLIHHWLCNPLCQTDSINQRLDAVEELLAIPETLDETRILLEQIPDLERLLSKIHTQGNASRSRNHPDSRAVFYEDNVYSKRKIMDLLSALLGFKTAQKIIQCFHDLRHDIKSSLLRKCVVVSDSSRSLHPGDYPFLDELLTFFDKAFDHEQAKKEGRIIPCKGVDKEYDSAFAEMREVELELDEYLHEQRNYFGCKISYWGTDRKRFQLEIPDYATRKVDNDYELQSQKKGFKRYWTETTKSLLQRMQNAEEHKENALKDVCRRMFSQFDTHFKAWEKAIECLSVLDVLVSLATYAKRTEGIVTRPTFVPFDRNIKPFINIRNGCHPCIIHTASGDDFIPNDVVIQTDDQAASLVIVTGPNMGGKSTLMRQVGLVIIMAQMGCYVPATNCTLTPVDRIFTRLGASDNIMGGESTFYVELSEISSILLHATPHSLVLTDELGRGTATHDGTAIAYAVVKELVNIGCRTLFSTHYHTLVEDFAYDSRVSLGHMACMVENECEDDPTQETITFLYKFIPGACPKSYGFNAARLAGLPDEVIRHAHKAAIKFEESLKHLHLLRALSSESMSTKQFLTNLTK